MKLSKQHEAYGLILEAKIEELKAAGVSDVGDNLWNKAVKILGNEDGRYNRFYICLECGELYHGDDSGNSDPDRDFCSVVCEWNWLRANPGAEYHGELLEKEK